MSATALEREATSWNIASALREMARSRPHVLAVACPSGRDRSGRARYVHRTFAQLDHDSDKAARALVASGIGPGTRTVLMVPPGLEFFALTFALFKVGAVPVLIDPGMGVRNLGVCLAEAEPEAFVGIPKAQAARAVLGWGRGSIRKVFTVGRDWPGRGNAKEQATNEPFPIAVKQPDETAAILFTSGSTGVAKGAVYTHAIFTNQVRMLQSLYGIEPGEVDLCTFPLFALFAPTLGMSAVVPDMDATRPARVDPGKIIEAIEDFGVTNMFGSPVLLRRVGEWGSERRISLPSLRRVISAGAPVPASVLERFATMLGPDARIHTPYGATEALPVCSITSDVILESTRFDTDRGLGVCVGRPVEGVRVEIIAIRDEPIECWSEDLIVPDGEVGEIVVRGPIVTRSYVNRPEATALAKIADPEAGPDAFWHRMGDLGRRDEQGRIWFHGRKSQRVVTESGTLFTIPCEAVFNVHPRVRRTALVGVVREGKTIPVLCVEPMEPLRKAERGRLREELRLIAQRFPHTRMIDAFLFHPAFPVDIRHNAKIFREKLAVWAARTLR